MKSFREHLIESKQTYNFKIKIVGDQDAEAADKIKSVLDRYKVETFSEAKTTPIQETQADFPSHQNVSVTMFEADLCYPATTVQIQNLVAEALNLSHSCVKIRTSSEQDEDAINHAYDEKSDIPLLGTDYDKSSHQDVVGDKHIMSLLKELGKEKHQGTQYKGVNDKILAKKAPSEKVTTVKADKKIGTVSAVGSQKIEKPTAATIGK
jgi:hypothetical protein